MLDDLRNSSVFIDEEETPNEPAPEIRPRVVRRKKESFLGMTAFQRFLLSLMLFFMILILGAFALVASGSVYLPF